MVADGRVRRARQPALADDGRDLRRGDPRALARQADARLRRGLVPGAAGRCRAKVPVDEHEVPTIAAALELAADRGASSAARRASTCAREHDLDRVADALRRALEEAAGGEAVADAVLWRIARPRRKSASRT